MVDEPAKFSSTLPIDVYIRHGKTSENGWTMLDRGPGIFHIPAAHFVMIRVRNVNDDFLKNMVKEIIGLDFILSLNLSENRKITDRGLKELKPLEQLTELNLSSCDITDLGISSILLLTRLERVDLSFCNRLTDSGIIQLKRLPQLTYLNLRGVPRITNGSLSKIRNTHLEIHRWK